MLLPPLVPVPVPVLVPAAALPLVLPVPVPVPMPVLVPVLVPPGVLLVLCKTNVVVSAGTTHTIILAVRSLRGMLLNRYGWTQICVKEDGEKRVMQPDAPQHQAAANDSRPWGAQCTTL